MNNNNPSDWSIGSGDAPPTDPWNDQTEPAFSAHHPGSVAYEVEARMAFLLPTDMEDHGFFFWGWYTSNTILQGFLDGSRSPTTANLSMRMISAVGQTADILVSMHEKVHPQYNQDGKGPVFYHVMNPGECRYVAPGHSAENMTVGTGVDIILTTDSGGSLIPLLDCIGRGKATYSRKINDKVFAMATADTQTPPTEFDSPDGLQSNTGAG